MENLVTASDVVVDVPAKKSRLRPAVQQRYGQTLEAVKTVLGDGKPRGVSELSRCLVDLGLIGVNVWSDVYTVLKTHSCFVRVGVEGSKRERWALSDATPATVDAPTVQESDAPTVTGASDNGEKFETVTTPKKNATKKKGKGSTASDEDDKLAA